LNANPTITKYVPIPNNVADAKNLLNIESMQKDIDFLKTQINDLETLIPKSENNLERKEKFEAEIQELISQYEEEPVESSISEDLEYLQNYYKAELVKEKQKKSIEEVIQNENFSSSYKIFQKDLRKLKIKLEDLREIYTEDEIDETEEELQKIIQREEKIKDTHLRLKKDIQKLEDEKDKNTNDIKTASDKYISTYEEIKNIEDLEDIIKENKDNIKTQEENKQEHNNNLELISAYNEYIENKNKYTTWKTKLKVLQEKEKEDKAKYSAALLLKEKILEAESIAVTNVVESINTNAQIYLDLFFVDNPIIVRLLSFKESKKNMKPQINIEIQYKDMDADLNTLSEGELSRVVLAFTLSLSDMFNTPVILLDEPTSTLDQDTTSIVFDALRDNLKNKAVIIIAHQVVNGMFDKVITL
jgi:DNA repair exonuclease SbcCD ATPase subunit